MTIETNPVTVDVQHDQEDTWEQLISPELIERLEDYLAGEFLEQGHVVPSVAGAAVYLGVNSIVLAKWSKHKRYGKEISRLLAALKDRQELVLLSGGLSGRLNSTITKLVLHKHGYNDKVEHSAVQDPDKNELKPAIFQGVAKGGKEDSGHSPALGMVIEDKPTAFKQETFNIQRANATAPMEDLNGQEVRAKTKERGTHRDRWSQRLNNTVKTDDV